MTSSEIISKDIFEKVLAELNAADEICGPDVPEYIELMDSLANHCQKLAQNARGAA